MPPIHDSVFNTQTLSLIPVSLCRLAVREEILPSGFLLACNQDSIKWTYIWVLRLCFGYCLRRPVLDDSITSVYSTDTQYLLDGLLLSTLPTLAAGTT